MGQFDHYPDMNQDGKHDLYDCVVFHEMMEEDEAEEQEEEEEYIPAVTDIHGNKIWPAQRGPSKEDVFLYRVICATFAFITGLPGIALLNSDPSDSLFLSILTLVLLICCIVSLKELIFGWPQ